MSLQPKPFLSLDDWLAGERAALETRSEYLDGEVFAMTGASFKHNIIVVNISRELSTQLKGRPCQVYANDMKVLIRSANAGKYPDLVAHCGEPELLDDRQDILLNPGLIVEVLSASTETYDRGASSPCTAKSRVCGNTYWSPRTRSGWSCTGVVRIAAGP